MKDPRSYDHRGRQVTWHRPAQTRRRRGAIDVEHVGRPVDPAMAHRLGEPDERTFLARWTVTETLAKLIDLPILVYLDRHGLAEPAPPGTSRRLEAGRCIELVHLWVPAEESFVSAGNLAPHPGY